MKTRLTMSMLAIAFAISAGVVRAQTATTPAPTKAPAPTTHAVAGDVEKVSDDGKKITIKTADGTEDVFATSGKAVATGAKEGSHVIVHYTGVGAEKTAVGVKDAGKGTWEVTKGTVTKVGEGGKAVTVKLADGTEKTFDVSKEAAVESAHGVKTAGMYTGKAGDKVVLYSTVDPTKDVVHLFKKL